MNDHLSQDTHSTYTPGPWRADTDGNIRDADNKLIASTYAGPHGFKEANKNAKLMAASPELLAALKLSAPLLIGKNFDLAQLAIAHAEDWQ